MREVQTELPVQPLSIRFSHTLSRAALHGHVTSCSCERVYTTPEIGLKPDFKIYVNTWMELKRPTLLFIKTILPPQTHVNKKHSVELRARLPETRQIWPNTFTGIKETTTTGNTWLFTKTIVSATGRSVALALPCSYREESAGGAYIYTSYIVNKWYLSTRSIIATLCS